MNDYVYIGIDNDKLSLQVTDIELLDYGQEPDWKLEEIPTLYYNSCTDEWSYFLRVSAESCWEEWQRMKRQEGEWRLA